MAHSHRSEHTRPVHEQNRLETIAGRSQSLAIILGLFLPPLAYLYVKKPGWALLNLLTLNFGIVGGLLIVPYHTASTIDSARDQLASDAEREPATADD